MTDETDPKIADRSDANEKESDIYGKAPDGKAPLPVGVSEDEREAYEAHQEELRLGRGDTRVTPISRSDASPQIMTPLEQATVPVDVHVPGHTVRVENASPVAPPAGADSGLVVTDEAHGGKDGLQDAFKPGVGQTVDVAATAIKTDNEAVAAQEDIPSSGPADEVHAETPNPAGQNYGAEE